MDRKFHAMILAMSECINAQKRELDLHLPYYKYKEIDGILHVHFIKGKVVTPITFDPREMRLYATIGNSRPPTNERIDINIEEVPNTTFILNFILGTAEIAIFLDEQTPSFITFNYELTAFRRTDNVDRETSINLMTQLHEIYQYPVITKNYET
jgi:hypothetical protein